MSFCGECNVPFGAVINPFYRCDCKGVEVYTDFLSEVRAEVISARKKFPDPDALLAALTEEVGEVAKAMLDEHWGRVRAECVQVAAMALRLAEEGDPTMTEVRKQRGDYAQGYGPKCPYKGCADPCRMSPPCALCYE